MLRIHRRPATDDSGGNSPTRGWQPRQIIEDSGPVAKFSRTLTRREAPRGARARHRYAPVPGLRKRRAGTSVKSVKSATLTAPAHAIVGVGAQGVGQAGSIRKRANR